MGNSLYIFAFIFPLLGLIFCIVALVQLHNNPEQKGKILAWIGLAVSILILVLFLYYLFYAIEYYYDPYEQSCYFEIGIDCDNYHLYSENDTMVITLQNNRPNDIHLISIEADIYKTYLVSNVSENVNISCTGLEEFDIPIGNSATMTAVCDNLPVRGYMTRSFVTLSYKHNKSDKIFNMTGELRVKTE
ncbi:hypothetical protein K9M79_04260 [Candidatus Woesearchaeota archaeon]|nr:hypothetical protein [Candidatus Woesearchaeota archaeon]